MKTLRNTAFGAALISFGTSALAALDTAAVKTSIDSAEASATTVGGYVVAAVAALVAVGLVISVVKKI